MSEHAEPGWFDDPLDTSNGQQRWWNGQEWTRHVCPNASTLVERVGLTGRHFRVAGDDRLRQSFLHDVRATMIEMADCGAAIEGREYEEATFDGSFDQGSTVIRATEQLMLRAYNVEADQIVEQLIADRLNHGLHALETARAHLDELGQSVGLRIASEYHAVRCREMELVAEMRGWAETA